MTILCFEHSSSCACHWLLHTSVWDKVFDLWYALFTSVTFHHLWLISVPNVSVTLIWVLKGNEQDPHHQLQALFSKTFEYVFWKESIILHTGDIRAKFVTQSIARFFWHVCSQWLLSSPLSCYYITPSLWVWTLRWIFPNHHYTPMDKYDVCCRHELGCIILKCFLKSK